MKPAPSEQPHWFRFARFSVIGLLLCCINLALLWLLVDKFRMNYILACTILFFALNLLGYVLHKVVTFGMQPEVDTIEVGRYFAVMGASLAANLGLMYVLVSVAGFGVLQASMLVSVLLAFANYLGHAKLTFAGPPPACDSPLRILQVSAFFASHGGGIESVAGQLADRLPAGQGLTMCWIAGGALDEAPEQPATPSLRIIQAQSVDPLEARLGLPFPIWGPGSLGTLWREVGNAQVVHVHDYLYMPSLAAALFARLRGRPLLVTQHIGDIPFSSSFARSLLSTLNRTLGKMVLRTAAKTVFVSLPVQRAFDASGRWPRPSQLIPNGVDHKRYFPAQPDPKRADKVSLLFVGRFVEKKGMQLIRNCLGLEGARWTFIGWGPLVPVDSPAENVRVLGRLPAHEIVAHYQQADLLVLPSTGEGFPLVVQEALACGTPVLVSTEVAEAFPVRDPRCVFDAELRCEHPQQVLQRVLKDLVTDRNRLQQARQAALELADQWSWDRCIADYRGIYERLVRDNRGLEPWRGQASTSTSAAKN